jgi:gamma-glutamylcyclotransferase (GGCT)/AIG2-like uncharacterized protein YtfP
MIPLFVYGSLQPGGQYWPDYCEQRVERLCPASVRGSLYDLPLGYPALVAAGSRQANWVQGYLLWLKSSKDLFKIDQLEGYRTERPAIENEYNRRQIDCYDAHHLQRITQAWVYEMHMDRVCELKGTVLRSGKWSLA